MCIGVIGFDSTAEYDRERSEMQYFATTVGRVANRVSNSNFKIDGDTTRIGANEGKNSLHGGFHFHRKLYKAKEIKNGVEFSRTAADGEDNYPGKIHIVVRYTLINRSLL